MTELEKNKYLETAKSNTETVYDDAQAQALRNSNYKTYYNSQLQLANTKRLAQQYLANNAAQSGMASQGVTGSNYIALNNSYANQYMQNQNAYQTQEDQITQDAYSRYNDEVSAKDQNLINYIYNATDYGDAMGYLKNSGYYTDEGGIDLSSLSADRQRALTDALANKFGQEGSAKRLVATGNMVEVADWDNTDGESIPYFDGNGNRIKADAKHNSGKALVMLKGYTQDGANDGTAFRLASDSGSGESMYVLHSGGKYYIMTPAQYNAYNGKKMYFQGKQQVA